MNQRLRADHAQRYWDSAFGALAVVLAALGMLSLAGCSYSGYSFLETPDGAIVGRSGLYNYSPSVIQMGDVQKFWWCGSGKNPANPSQNSDVILYESVNTVTHAKDGPVIVLAETKGAWDQTYTCNARVIRGTFTNPLGDGETYSYEMFYVGATHDWGAAIGAAFSNDGIQWTKYPEPVIPTTSYANYGVGQPGAYNVDGKSSITLFYEDYTPLLHHVEATSTDGVHFTIKGTLTTNGLDPTHPNPDWGDIGYDPSTKYWYAAFDMPIRAPSTTGDFGERGQYGFQLYRIPDSSLLTGAEPWQMLKIVDTNLTGYESNFLPSLLHGPYGNINVGSYPTLQLFVSTALPRPPWDASPKSAGEAGNTIQWAIAVNSYTPNQNILPLKRFVNDKTYVVTTGWIDTVKFFSDTTVAHLFATPQHGADVPFYGCKQDAMGYFISLHQTCDGQRILGINGYGYAKKPAGITTIPLYSCTSTHYGKFLDRNSACKGNGKGELFAYALP
jgi:hypothetical protein